MNRSRRVVSEYMYFMLCKWIFRGVIGSQSFQNTQTPRDTTPSLNGGVQGINCLINMLITLPTGTWIRRDPNTSLGQSRVVKLYKARNCTKLLVGVCVVSVAQHKSKNIANIISETHIVSPLFGFSQS